MQDRRNRRERPRRRYPAAFERGVPIALGIIAIAIVVLIAVSLAVVLGVFPGR
jgi:hypothetical protein